MAIVDDCSNDFQLSSGIERLGHEGRKDMGRLGSWMQPHIDRIGERVGQVRVIESMFDDGEDEYRKVERHFGQSYVFETSPSTSPLYPTGDYISSLICQVGQSLGERVGQVNFQVP